MKPKSPSFSWSTVNTLNPLSVSTTITPTSSSLRLGLVSRKPSRPSISQIVQTVLSSCCNYSKDHETAILVR
eukprot:m.51607 g.51607  ORF g.51607 m.51607 type:complete len:72 (-) comp11247_c0_seq4:19-234(-)